MSANIVVRLRGVVCTAGDRPILEVDDFEVREGERVAILGANGAGKTTLLRLIGGGATPQHGEVEVLGRNLGAGMTAGARRASRREVGQVMQGLHLVPRLSSLENAAIGGLGRVRGWRGWTRCYPRQEVDDAEAALKSVGMLARAQTRADRLSGGERQKVAIARLLVQRPRLILADEPTAALDPAAAADVCQLLARAASGATLVSVVHNPSLLPVLADRVVGLKRGKVVFDAPLSSVGDEQLIGLYRPGGGGDPQGHETAAAGLLVTRMEMPT